MTASAGYPAVGQLSAIWSALGGAPEFAERVRFTGDKSVTARYPVTDFAAATIAAGGAAVAELLAAADLAAPDVTVDRELSLAWFRRGLDRPIGWAAAEGSSMTGEYRTADDRWIRLQMNYPRHLTAVLRALGCEPRRDAVAAALRALTAEEADAVLTEAGGAVAVARTVEEWEAHPQRVATRDEPLVDVSRDVGSRDDGWTPFAARPLAGVRVLDMTRVLAGPMATRFLASYGAEVLRIDPPGYDEPRGAVLVTTGKRCARVDATTAEGRETLRGLLATCDVMVHGYRDGVLERLGLGAEERARVRPGLVEATLTAYGWSGPWRDRRGFDTLVEMATGMALEEAAWAGEEGPVLLPVQSLDYGTGQLLAASVIRGLTGRLRTGEGSRWRCALTRTASFLMAEPEAPITSEIDFEGLPRQERVVRTPRGPARRLVPPLEVDGAPQYWDWPGEPFGSSRPVWAVEEPIPAT